jgi:hypothetical protein
MGILRPSVPAFINPSVLRTPRSFRTGRLPSLRGGPFLTQLLEKHVFEIQKFVIRVPSLRYKEGWR